MTSKRAENVSPMRNAGLSGTSSAADGPLTVRYLFWFSLPLAMTFLMMSGSAPIVSNGITWMNDADGERLHLSAFLLTFASSVMLYSPMFVARNVAIRVIADRRSMRRFAIFMVGCASMSSVVILAVSQVDAVGHLFFHRMLNADPEAAALAREGMLLFVPIPVLIALRAIGQGCHISNGHNWYVGAGTALRLLTMGAFVFGYAIRTEMSGPMLGGYTYLLGIGAETLFVIATLWNKPQWRTVNGDPLLNHAQFVRYVGPLMLGSVAGQLQFPILIYLVNIGWQPGENAATYNLIRDTAWMMFSTIMAVQPAAVRHATSMDNLRVIIRFTALLVGAITGVVLLIALTPIREAIFVGWLDVQNLRIRELTFTALLFLAPVPLINGFNLLTAALHTRSGRTLWVTAGNFAGLGLLLLAAGTLNLSAVNGVFVAVMGQAAFNLTAGLVQTLGLLNGRLAEAVSPGSLVQHLDRNAATAEPPGDELPAPIPEAVVAPAGSPAKPGPVN